MSIKSVAEEFQNQHALWNIENAALFQYKSWKRDNEAVMYAAIRGDSIHLNYIYIKPNFPWLQKLPMNEFEHFPRSNTEDKLRVGERSLLAYLVIFFHHNNRGFFYRRQQQWFSLKFSSFSLINPRSTSWFLCVVSVTKETASGGIKSEVKISLKYSAKTFHKDKIFLVGHEEAQKVEKYFFAQLSSEANESTSPNNYHKVWGKSVGFIAFSFCRHAVNTLRQFMVEINGFSFSLTWKPKSFKLLQRLTADGVRKGRNKLRRFIW